MSNLIGYIIDYNEYIKKVRCYSNIDNTCVEYYIPIQTFIYAEIEIAAGKMFELKVVEVEGKKQVILENASPIRIAVTTEIEKIKKEIEEYLK